MKYFIEKVRNGCWRCVWEDGTYTEHSSKEGAEKAAFLNLPRENPDLLTTTHTEKDI